MDFTRDKHKNIKLLLPSQFHDIDQYLEHILVAAQLDADIIQLDGRDHDLMFINIKLPLENHSDPVFPKTVPIYL